MSAESTPSVRTLPRVGARTGRVRYNAKDRKVVERSKAMRIAALARRVEELAAIVGRAPGEPGFDLRVTLSDRTATVFE